MMKKGLIVVLAFLLAFSSVLSVGAKETNNTRKIYKSVDGNLVEISEEEFANRHRERQQKEVEMIKPLDIVDWDYIYIEEDNDTYLKIEDIPVDKFYNNSSTKDSSRNETVTKSVSTSFNISLSADFTEEISNTIGIQWSKTKSVSDSITVTAGPKEWGYAVVVSDIYYTEGGKYRDIGKGGSNNPRVADVEGEIVTDLYVITDTRTSKPILEIGSEYIYKD